MTDPISWSHPLPVTFSHSYLHPRQRHMCTFTAQTMGCPLIWVAGRQHASLDAVQNMRTASAAGHDGSPACGVVGRGHASASCSQDAS